MSTHTVTVVEAAPTPAVILRRAAAYLAEYGWWQGDYYGPARPKPPCCAAGAIAMAVYGCVIDVPSWHGQPGHQQFRAAFDALADYLWLPRIGDAEWCAATGEPPDNGMDVFGWNDSPDRTVREVIADLYGAADFWDASHQEVSR